MKAQGTAKEVRRNEPVFSAVYELLIFWNQKQNISISLTSYFTCSLEHKPSGNFRVFHEIFCLPLDLLHAKQSSAGRDPNTHLRPKPQTSIPYFPFEVKALVPVFLDFNLIARFNLHAFKMTERKAHENLNSTRNRWSISCFIGKWDNWSFVCSQ
jgi:hypothetical protein